MNYWEGKMIKRYYYDCPIKALYMMKEFGVKFEQFLYSDFHSLERKLLSVSFEWICQNKNLNDKIEFENRLIVAEESEHIFEPKKGDNDKNGLFFDGRHWTDRISYAISSERSKTSFRFDKQFFMPEVEND